MRHGACLIPAQRMRWTSELEILWEFQLTDIIAYKPIQINARAEFG